ncbi:MAG: AAA-like domain-containing protein [Cyanobacteria bacterium J06554_6]
MSSSPSPYRHLGGSLPLDDPTYVVRAADQQLYQALRDREFCYVLNSRQMGKSSLRVRVMQQLQANGIACGVVDLSAMGTESTESAWYKGLAYRIMRNFRVGRAGQKASSGQSFNWREWWKEHDFLSPVQQLDELVQAVLLPSVSGEIVIFFDEIDSVLSLDFPTDDFFAWIRSCYNSRADDTDYQRLTFCLLGVATPGDLISDKKRTPFNMGRAIPLDGFEFRHAQGALQTGLTQAAIPAPEAVLRKILDWTGGQPFLTQKLCQLVVSHWPAASAQAPASAVDTVVQEHILTNWESRDEPEHLRTIRDRFYAHPDRTNRLLGLYQQILSQGGIKSNDSPEQRELRLTGLTVKRQNQLQVFNPIYHRIFDMGWVSQALADIRPYAQSLEGWLASDKDDRCLLTGATLAAAKAWAHGKSLSDQDYTYLAACQQAETEQAEAALAVEAQAKQVLAEANRQANRRIRTGVGVLGLAAALLTGSLVFSAQTVRSARAEASEAQAIAAQARLATADSQAIADEERENAEQARQAVAVAERKTQAERETTQQARQDAESAIADAEAAEQTAQTAQQTAQRARQTAQTAQQTAAAAQRTAQQAEAETTLAVAQRTEAEQQATQARENLAVANQQVAVAATQRRELTVGTQLERSALALMRTSARPSIDALAEAVRLGEALQPFLSDERSVSRYPAVAPILALQILLNQAGTGGELASFGPVVDASLEPIVRVWFSADARRYATLHSYDGFRNVYLQFWNGQGEPEGPAVDVENGYGGGSIPRPLSLYLLSDRARTETREQALMAVACGRQTICIRDFDHDFNNRQVDQVPGEQAAFNVGQKELVTLDEHNVLRRWQLFEQGQWVGEQTEEKQLDLATDDLYLTTDGQYLWTYQEQSRQVLVFDLAGQLIKSQPSPGPAPSPNLAFSPEGDIIEEIELSTLPGQGRQAWSLPLRDGERSQPLSFGISQTAGSTALVRQTPDGDTFQLYDATGQKTFEYPSAGRITLFSQPEGEYVATVECGLPETPVQDCLGRVWDEQGQMLTALAVLDGGLRWTPNGRYLATWDREQLRLIDMEQFSLSTYRTGGDLIAFQLGSTPDQPLYFWIRRGTGAELWQMSERAPIATAYPLGMNATVRTAWYDATEQRLLVVSDHVEHGTSLVVQSLDPSIDLGETLIELGRVKDAAFSPQGDRIVVSQYNGDLQLWTVNGSLEASFVGHEGPIDAFRFSPDGSQLLTYSGADRTVRLWDSQGRQMAQYESAQAPAISGDWSRLITIAQRPSLHPQVPAAQLKVWSIDSLETLLADACQRLQPYLSRNRPRNIKENLGKVDIETC